MRCLSTGTVRPDEHDWWLERAAVREYDGGERRPAAEFHALLEPLEASHARLSARVTESLGRPRPAGRDLFGGSSEPSMATTLSGRPLE